MTNHIIRMSANHVQSGVTSGDVPIVLKYHKNSLLASLKNEPIFQFTNRPNTIKTVHKS